MLVKIKGYEYLLDNKDVDPSINSDMLEMAGETFHILDSYIDNTRWYDYRGWKWLGDWLYPASATEATRDDVCPPQDITPDVTRHHT